MDQDEYNNSKYTKLLEIDTFRVVKDTDFGNAGRAGVNNTTPHWIAHMCDAYMKNEDHDVDGTGVFDADEIKQGSCYYCKAKIPEAITALWAMLEWKDAGDILHNDDEIYQGTGAL